VAWVTAGGVLTAAAGAYLDLDFGAAAAARVFGIFRTNLTTAATLTVTMGTSAGASDVYAPGAESGLAAGIGQIVHVAAADQTARYCRLALDDAANPDNQLKVGLAFAGPVGIPTYNFARPWARGRAGQAFEVGARAGSRYAVPGPVARSLRIELPELTEAEAFGWADELDRVARLGGNVIVVPRPDGAYLQTEAVFGRLRAETGFENRRTAGEFAYALTVTERL
jgi:hypothetical protein